MLADHPIHHIPNGVDATVFQVADKKAARVSLGLPDDRPIIAFSAWGASANEYKGFVYLREALSRVAESLPVRLLLIGGPTPSAEESGQLDIIGTGPIQDDRLLAQYYSASDMFVLPSVAENCPLALLEAMACGLPAVAFRLGGIPELLSHLETGYLARPLDAEDLARGLLMLLRDADFRRWAGIAARETVEQRYTTAVQLSRYLTLYEELGKIW
jgi:glycosyltransferase involved in cell wall biosynthesis